VAARRRSRLRVELIATDTDGVARAVQGGSWV